MIKKISLVLVSLFMLSLVFAQSNTTESYFNTGSAAYRCISADFEAHWEKFTNGETVNIYSSGISTVGVCNDTNYSLDWCCPNNFQCNNEGVCESLNLEYNGNICTTLTDNNTCNTAPTIFATNLIDAFTGGTNSGVCSSESTYIGYFDAILGVCANVTTCGCVWINDSCNLDISIDKICSNGISSIGNCTWSENSATRQDLCSTERKIVINYPAVEQGVYTGAMSCTDQTVDYPCSVSVQLPFFDKFSFILCIVVIVGIYAFFRRSNYEK